MYRTFTKKLILLLLPAGLMAQNGTPVIQNFTASVDWNTHTLLLQYDVDDPENDALDISVEFSQDGGKTYSLTGDVALSGDVGFPVTPGAGRSITCDVSGLSSAGTIFTVRIVADDRQPFDFQGLVNEVDSNRLRADLTFVEGVRHRTTGLAHLNAVRDSIGQLFTGFGLYTEEHTFPYGTYTGRNVLGSYSGVEKPDSVVIIDAHYDTVPIAPGADDNGSGTVGVMEAARLLSRYPFKKTLRFIGFDLEESSLVGSQRYVSSGLAPVEKVAGVFNFEMIGYYTNEPNTQDAPIGFNLFFPDVYNDLVADQFRGNFITNVGVSTFGALNNLFSASASAYVPDLKVVSLIMTPSLLLPDLLRSDHASFLLAGLPALMLTDGADFRNKCYHTASDTLDNKLDFTFMANVVKATVASTAQLAEIIHGDWAVTSFDGTVGTSQTLPSCTISAAAYPANSRRIGVNFGGCPVDDLSFGLFDVKGALMYREQLSAPPVQGWHELDAPPLPPGIYFLQVQSREGRRTLKIPLF